MFQKNAGIVKNAVFSFVGASKNLFIIPGKE